MASFDKLYLEFETAQNASLNLKGAITENIKTHYRA